MILEAHQGTMQLEFQRVCHIASVDRVGVHNLVGGSSVSKTDIAPKFQSQDGGFLETKWYQRKAILQGVQIEVHSSSVVFP